MEPGGHLQVVGELKAIKGLHGDLVGDKCTINFGATVMGGAGIERDTTLLPLSLVLKEMNLLTATYEGGPAESVR